MKENIRKVILVISIGVFLYSAYQLASIFYNYYMIEKETNDLTQEVVKVEEDDTNPLHRVVDFDKLKKTNKDVVGWLYIPDTKIDEPVLKGATNDTYIRTDIYKKSNSAGSLFIDERNEKPFEDNNTIIYGHNMKNGSRFHDLRYYTKDDYFKAHQLAYIYLPDGTINVYDIFATDVIDAYSDLYATKINYKKYIDNVLKGASVKSDVNKEEKPLIMLSTCYTTNSDDRNVVFARLKENVKAGQ